ncbi:MAG: TlpA family protein disulfide reductase [Oscillospiraceae bacterium]|nr:TlpA family protein disulfide reductase [Oscillospiraceae bacterium]
MNKRNVIIFSLVAVVCFVGVYFLYNGLKEEYKEKEVETTTVTTTIIEEENPATEKTLFYPQNVIKAEDFVAYDIDGNEVKLSDCYGKPIVLNFWSTWCNHCKIELPLFEKSYKENPDITFIMINITAADDVKLVNELLEKNGYTFTVWLDENADATEKYSVSSIPATYFIDKNGNIVNHTVGEMDEATLEKRLEMIREK